MPDNLNKSWNIFSTITLMKSASSTDQNALVCELCLTLILKSAKARGAALPYTQKMKGLFQVSQKV